MIRAAAIPLLGLIAALSAAADSPRPRGVGPEFAKFYKDQASFTCISSPHIKLAPSRINDDYCDCPDGSDEPGTSACSYISSLSPSILPDEVDHAIVNASLALPGYYCKNKGHQPGYIPFTNVNDGVCDYELCCDGSDEWAGVGKVKCENKCKEIGAQWRKQDEIRQRALSSANKRRNELITESARLRREVADRIKSLGEEIKGAELRVQGLERDLVEIERQERNKVVKAGSGGGRLGVLTGLAKGRINELRENLVAVREERDSGYERVRHLEQILAAFKEEYNPNFNDEGVKTAVRAWEDYAASGRLPELDSKIEQDITDMAKSDEENGLNWAEFAGQEEGDIDVLYKFEEYLPGAVREWVDKKLRDLRVMLIDNGILAPASEQSGESQAVKDARDRLNAAKNELNGHNTSLDQHKEDLEKDYGPEDIFRALKGQCISKDSGEYTYELCWMERTVQKKKRGGGDTTMGNFMRIDTVEVDEDIDQDGKGLGSGVRVALRYENGLQCWNGPQRSTTVILACAAEDEIWKIVEEEKCVYRMEVGTAAVCERAPGEKPHVKDEL
ncbi:MAG: hypothetical protein M1821_001346 [Bathelium mastoideum]|nr:MAG: hypothetical protein M1821_001346 [Bathelium mastoideum]KAI9689871.1 MAG: hypothetical protein M1822_009753 [Bathelium mastoideum]